MRVSPLTRGWKDEEEKSTSVIFLKFLFLSSSTLTSMNIYSWKSIGEQTQILLVQPSEITAISLIVRNLFLPQSSLFLLIWLVDKCVRALCSSCRWRDCGHQWDMCAGKDSCWCGADVPVHPGQPVCGHGAVPGLPPAWGFQQQWGGLGGPQHFQGCFPFSLNLYTTGPSLHNPRWRGAL